MSLLMLMRLLMLAASIVLCAYYAVFQDMLLSCPILADRLSVTWMQVLYQFCRQIDTLFRLLCLGSSVCGRHDTF